MSGNAFLWLRLVFRFLAGGMIATGALWWGLDARLSSDIETITRQALERELEDESRQDRIRLDQSVRSHLALARLLGGQTSIAGHADGVLRTPASSPSVVAGEPGWLPPRGERGTFPPISFVLIANRSGQVHEVVSLAGDAIPVSLGQVDRDVIVPALGQSRIVSLGDAVFIASAAETGDNGATLVLLSRLDSRFLSFNHQSGFQTGHVIAVGDRGQRAIVASSNTGLVVPGTAIPELSRDWLVVGVGSLDLGGAGVEAYFLTLVSRKMAADRVRPILEQERSQRIVLAAAMSGLMLLMLLLVAWRLRTLIRQVGRAVGRVSGVAVPKFVGGDELSELLSRIEGLTDEVLKSRDLLQAEKAEHVRLVTERVAIESENERLRLLFSITDLLGVGVLRISPAGPISENSVMDLYVQSCGGPDVLINARTGVDRQTVPINCHGQTRFFELREPAIPDGNILLVTDVTDRRQTEETVKEFALFPAQNPCPVLRIGLDGTILHANRASAGLLEEWKTETGGLLPELWRKRVGDISLGERSRVIECDIGERTFALSFVPIPGADYVNVYASDITARLEAERLLAAANEDLEIRVAERTQDLLRAKNLAEEANRAKTEFLAMVSHELRTPLNAIIGFSEIMQGGLFGAMGNPRYESYVEDIIGSARHLLNAINDILDMVRIESGEMVLSFEQVGVAQTIETALRLIAEPARMEGVQVIATPISPSLTIPADRRRLLQILLNLLSNAVKFTPRDGAVEISARADSHWVWIAVKDSGIGMADDEIAVALQPFRQVDSSLARRHDGTGLGLPLARSLAELHGGSLAVSSARGIGTEVIVTLPLIREHP